MRVTIYDHELDRTAELELTASQYDELKAFLRGLKKPPELDYKQVLERYNALCRSLPPATRLTDELFRKAAESAFLCGENAQKWRASLDWLLIPSNAVKVLEGNYAPAPDTRGAPDYTGLLW